MPAEPDPLRDALGATPPASVAALPSTVRADLATRIESARRLQDRALEGSITQTLKAVPLPLRGIVKKVLLG